MNLTASTDFELAARLLGAYYREVMATGMVHYPYHYEGALCTDPEPETWDLSCDLPPSATLAGTPSAPVSATELNLSHTDASLSNLNVEGTLTVAGAVNLPGNQPQSPAPEDASTPLPEDLHSLQSISPTPEERLEHRQAEELRLFYLYAQEIEQSGDLTRLPQVLRHR
jgi:hypothetical protein